MLNIYPQGRHHNRGALARGNNEGYLDRDQTGKTDSIEPAEGPPGVSKDDITYDPDNPNIARAANTIAPQTDETAGTDSQAQMRGSYPDIIEGSDSERTGTSWGIPGVEDAAEIEIESTTTTEGEQAGDARPTLDEVQNIGSWSTIGKEGSAGSPTGNS